MELIEFFKSSILICFILTMFGVFIQNDKLRLFFKVLTSLSILACAFVYSIYSEISYAFILPIGMSFGSIGDFLLGFKESNLIENKEKDICLRSGFIMFFIGHIVYFIAIYKFFRPRPSYIIIALTLSIILVICLFIFRKLKLFNYRKYFYTCMIYGYFLCFITVLSLILFFVQGPIAIGLFVGYLLFFISDLILMMIYFGKKELAIDTKAILTFINLATYFTAQFLIVQMFI